MTDKELIEKINSGEDKYLEILLEKHLQKIYSACFRVCLDENIANDIAQNVAIKILDNLAKFQFKSEFSTWYYRIAYNESINFLKKEKLGIDFEEFENTLEVEDNNFNNLDKQLLTKDITEAVNKLKIIDRNIILYFYYDDLKIKEISEILDINENTIKTRLKRAKIKLKSYLKQYENSDKTV